MVSLVWVGDNKGIGFRIEWFPWSGLGTIRVLVWVGDNKGVGY